MPKYFYNTFFLKNKKHLEIQALCAAYIYIYMQIVVGTY